MSWRVSLFLIVVKNLLVIDFIRSRGDVAVCNYKSLSITVNMGREWRAVGSSLPCVCLLLCQTWATLYGLLWQAVDSSSLPCVYDSAGSNMGHFSFISLVIASLGLS